MHQVISQTDAVVQELWFKDGDTVNAGDEVLMLEVMKMMIPYTTNVSGIIHYVATKGDYVKEGSVLAEIE